MAFYDKRLLDVKTGCFRIIWIAATKGKLLRRKDVLCVNISKICVDIKDHLIIRRPYPIPGQAPIRFSLYLSSQLAYGAVVILSKQTDYLSEDATSFMSGLKLVIARKSSIDLLRNINPENVTLPDPISTQNLRQYYYTEELLENLQNVFTHVITDNNSQEVLRGTSIEESRLKVSSLSSSIQSLRQGDLLRSPHTVSSLEEITIAASLSITSEVETLAAIQEDLLPEFGVPCEDIHSGSPVSHIHSSIPIVPSVGRPIHRAGSPYSPKVYITTEDMVPPVSQEILEEEPLVALTGQVEKQGKRLIQKKSRKLILEEIDPNLERRQSKRCKGPIVDKNIKISTQSLKKNLEHGSKTSETGAVKRAVADVRLRRATGLLKSPGIALSTALRPLFLRNCKLPSVVFLTDSESSSPSLLIRKADDSSMLQSSPAPLSTVQPLSPIVANSPSCHISSSKTVTSLPVPSSPNFSVIPAVDASITVDVSQRPPGTSSQTVLLRSSTPLQRSAPEHRTLIMEEDFVEDSHRESISNISFSKLIEDNLKENSWTTFRTLVPCSVSRAQASKCFNRLLELARRQRISLTQEKAFGEIYISHYEAV